MLFSARPAYILLRILTCLEILTSVVPSVANPLPMPLALMLADYSPSFIAVNRSIANVRSRRAAVPSHLALSGRPRDAASLSDLLSFYDAATSHANDLRDLAARSASVDDDDFDFQRDCVAALTGFNTNVDSFQTALAGAASSASGGSDKGLANYDKTNDLETLLKNLANLTKNVLSSIDALVYNLPVVGPILGPIVYDLKCLVDQILDQLEDFTDALINQLRPLFQALFGVSTTCSSGVDLLGLCI